MPLQVQGAKMTVPAGEHTVAAPPAPLAAAGGAVIDSPPSEHESELEEAVLGEQEDADLDLTDDDFSDDDDTDDEYVDSDSEFEDDDDQPPPLDIVGHGAAAPNIVSVPAVGFLGRPARFASVHNTAAFMRIAPAAAVVPGENAAGGGGGEVVVHYCYTRFLRARSGGDNGVEAHMLGPKLARVRFHLPAHAVTAAADPASTLRLAGAALAPLLYPARFSAELRALWSSLVAALPVPRATTTTRVVVTVDAGILQPGDWTPARMRSMIPAVESLAWERDTQHAAVFDVGAELLLPALLASEEDVRPAKRRRVAGEDCPICCEVLEQGLAAWPRCSHIFHATCLEEHLVRGHQECPMCRSELEVVSTV